MTKRAALYLRTSHRESTTENQRRQLTKAAKMKGWRVVAEFEDAAISGAKGRDQRPGLDALLKAGTRGEFDAVMAWSVDRLGRSLQDLVAFLQEVHALGIDLYLHQQAIDTTTPAGKAMFQMLGVFAEFERAIIRERIYAGLDRARAKGKKLGRPKINGHLEARIKRLQAGGASIRKIAKEAGVGIGTVVRVLKEAS